MRAPQVSGHNGVTTMYGTLQAAPAETPIAPRLPMNPQPPGFGPGAPGDYYSVSGYNHHIGTYPIAGEAPRQQYGPFVVFPNDDVQQPVKAEGLPEPRIKPVAYPQFQRQITGESDSAIELGFNDQSSHWPQKSEPSTARSAEFPPMFANNPSMPFPIQNNYTTPVVVPSVNPDLAGGAYSSWHTVPSYSAVVGSTGQDARTHSFTAQNPQVILEDQRFSTEEPDDDYFDVDSDQEDYSMKSAAGGALSYNVGPLLAMSANHGNGGTRSMTNYLNEPNVLATYRPWYTASPLMDPQTARIFCHFITATAPTLSVCERRPSNPAVMFSGAPVPKSQRSLWSYTLPMLALTHQGLLHAMLALSSLHISKLQHSSPTPSLKHYHFALRRVAKALGNPKKRKDVATLAATLLLGFYEVTTAEHNKWNSHLSGARELVMEIDFAGMARRIESHRRHEEELVNDQYQYQNDFSNSYHNFYGRRPSDEYPSREDRQLDENLVSTLMGWRLRYDRYGNIVDENDPPNNSDTPPTAEDVEVFEIQSDLFWWYAKQDIYQSIISGNRLL